jgi:hypothetical protein
VCSVTGWHNKFYNRVEKTHPNVWELFECFQREELAFRQQVEKINCRMEKKSNETGCLIQNRIKTLTERHEQKLISLLEFINGSSVVMARNPATVR